MSAAEKDLKARTAELAEARAAVARASESLADAVRSAHAAGLSKYRIRQITGLARATVDKWA